MVGEEGEKRGEKGAEEKEGVELRIEDGRGEERREGGMGVEGGSEEVFKRILIHLIDFIWSRDEGEERRRKKSSRAT